MTRIRTEMERNNGGILQGIIEADETFVGATTKRGNKRDDDEGFWSLLKRAGSTTTQNNPKFLISLSKSVLFSFGILPLAVLVRTVPCAPISGVMEVALNL